MTIVGANFGTSAPIVVLDGFVRPLVAFGPSQIIAVLPNSAPNNPGSYSLLMVPTT